MTETPTTPEPTDLELVEIAARVPLGGFLYRPIYDAGFAAGRTQALEEAAQISETIEEWQMEGEPGEWWPVNRIKDAGPILGVKLRKRTLSVTPWVEIPARAAAIQTGEQG